jgi:hypothetical protein
LASAAILSDTLVVVAYGAFNVANTYTIAQADATFIPDAIVDAKGDLIAATAADTVARLAVGNNGETLVADSSTSTGLRYQAPVQQNPVLNSAMQVFQRGTSAAGASGSFNGYAADRWQVGRGGFAAGSTSSQQLTNDTTNLPNVQYCLRVQRNSGNTSTAITFLTQNFESINSIPFRGKIVTFSFYARAGANFSSLSNALGAGLISGTGTDQNQFTSGFTGGVTPAGGIVTLTTTWQRFSFSGTVSTSANQLAIQFYYDPTGTAGVNDYFEITGVQVEVGSVATPFKTYAGTIQGELAACQRYYIRYTTSTVYGQLSTGGTGVSSTSVRGQWGLPVTMRIAPTSVDFSTIATYDTNAIAAISAVTIVLSTNQIVSADCTTTGATQYRGYTILSNNSTSGYIGFSAEL